MALQVLNTVKKDVSPDAASSQIERKPRPVLVKGSRRSASKSLPTSGPAAAVIHEVRELLQLAAVVLALAESRTSDDAELLHFLKLGERALADVGTLMAANFSNH
jgi:hypothetical protein